MRVLQLGPYPPPHGGVQANLSAIRAALLARGDTCPVMVITRADAGAGEIEVYRPQGPIELFITLIFLDFGVVHLHLGGNLSLRLLLLALVCAWLPGRRSVLTFHSGGYPSTPAGQKARPNSLAGFVFRQLDRVIGVNPAIIEMFERFGVKHENARLIYPHAIPQVDHSVSLPTEIQTFLAGHDQVLISVGLLEPEYDLKAQIDLMPALRKEFPGAGLIMIGSGSLASELGELIAASPERDHILLCGDVVHDVTVRILTESDLMLRTTLYDGDSISVREALALNLPVIATDNAMRPDGVALVPVRDPAALLARVKDHLRSPARDSVPISDASDNIAAVLALYDELESRVERIVTSAS